MSLATIQLALISATAVSSFASKLDGKVLYSEPLPDVVADLAEKALPSPVTLGAIASVSIEGDDLVGAIEVVDQLPILGLPLDVKHQLFSEPIGAIGAFLFGRAFPNGISDEVSAQLSVVPTAPPVAAAGTSATVGAVQV